MKTCYIASILALSFVLMAPPQIVLCAEVRQQSIVVGDPSIPVCPTSNCPAPPHSPVLATQWIHGSTTKGAEQPEWLSTLGLLVDQGNPDGQKVGQYIGVMQTIGAGTAWALNTDSVRNALPGGNNSFGGAEGSGRPGSPGAIGDANGTIGYELDFTNWDKDSGPGKGPFTVGQYIHSQGSYTSLAAIFMDAHMYQGRDAWHTGILFNDPSLISDHTIYDGTNALNSLSISGHHAVGVNTTKSNANLTALAMAPGQSVCFDGMRWCVAVNGNALSVTNSKGQNILSIDDEGNLEVSGRIKALNSP